MPLHGSGGRRVKAVSSREGLIFSWSSFSYYSEGQHSVAFIPNSNKVRGGRHSWGHSPPSPPAIDEIFWRGKQKILNGISESCRTEDQIFWREVAKKQKFFFWHLGKFSEDFGEKRALFWGLGNFKVLRQHGGVYIKWNRPWFKQSSWTTRQFRWLQSSVCCKAMQVSQ